jgi:sulfatase modifying factor 1
MRERCPPPRLVFLLSLLFPFLLTAGEPALSCWNFLVKADATKVLSVEAIPPGTSPRWALNVSQESHDWTSFDNSRAFFATPIPYVISPLYRHNHAPALTWLGNGDLLAIWFSTEKEVGTEMTILASRLRKGANQWEPSEAFFKASDRNMTGSSLFYDEAGVLYHFNGMGKENVPGWTHLVMMMRKSFDHGATWSSPRAINPRFQLRQQVIAGTLRTQDGRLIQCCDATPGFNGGSAIHISPDNGQSWTDPGQGKPKPNFIAGASGEGFIAGIHARVVELRDGSLLALARGDSIDGRMPMSLSKDHGKTWHYSASPFPPISAAQRLALIRLREGPLMLVSFTSGNFRKPEAHGMPFIDQEGRGLIGHGMYAALSFDEGKSWPLRKLLTPGRGSFNGGSLAGSFTTAANRAEHAGYIDATQSPDGVIHLISSGLYYRFNYPWLVAGFHR